MPSGGFDAAHRLAEAEDLADAVTPFSTVDSYAKSWRMWARAFDAASLP